MRITLTPAAQRCAVHSLPGSQEPPITQPLLPAACRAAARHRTAIARGVQAVLRHLPAEEARSLAEAKAFLLQFPLQ